MAVFRVEKKNNYTVMSNHHLRNADLSLRAKGLLSLMLSLPEEWDYTLEGLAKINSEGKDAIRATVVELEKAGYVERRRTKDASGKYSGNEYIIRENPVSAVPSSDFPTMAKPTLEEPTPENPTQISKDISSKDINKKKKPDGVIEGKKPELSMEALKPLICERCNQLDPCGRAPRLRELVTELYSPRVFRRGSSPPVKSIRGLNRLFSDLQAYGTLERMEKALERALDGGYTSIIKLENPAPVATPMEEKRWL